MSGAIRDYFRATWDSSDVNLFKLFIRLLRYVNYLLHVKNFRTANFMQSTSIKGKQILL